VISRGEPGVLVLEGLDLVTKRLYLPSLLNEVEESAISEDGADGQGEEGDDRAEDRRLPSQPRLRPSSVVTRGHT